MKQELLLNARTVVGEAEAMGFTNTAQAMRSVIEEFLTEETSLRSRPRIALSTFEASGT
ncbi:hypothetical protein [Roseobacter sp. EG26]|uniref:hypothetical protein n=1 Tax=Roseobacter sp. EG26 TaxID=3412477 RepID=UPI003CE4C382